MLKRLDGYMYESYIWNCQLDVSEATFRSLLLFISLLYVNIKPPALSSGNGYYCLHIVHFNCDSEIVWKDFWSDFGKFSVSCNHATTFPMIIWRVYVITQDQVSSDSKKGRRRMLKIFRKTHTTCRVPVRKSSRPGYTAHRGERHGQTQVSTWLRPWSHPVFF